MSSDPFESGSSHWEQREAEAMAFLESRVNLEKLVHFHYDQLEEKLATLRRVLEKMGNPERGFKTVHVTGSKGKGSVCVMIESILLQENYHVGCFTSPHLYSVNERIRIDGKPVPMRELVDELLSLKDRLEQWEEAFGLTYFDILTLAALEIFARSKLDVAILEVGMGGRFDSTNVCCPTVSAITGVELEHTDFLGDTIEKIATEKAGIIRPSVPVVLGDHFDNELFLRQAFSCNAPVYKPAREVVETVRLGMPGEHQQRNAAIAAAIARVLRDNAGLSISNRAIRKGVARAKLPLRVEQLHDDPLLILDAAHTPGSAAALFAELRNKSVAGRWFLLLGLMRGKDVEGVFREIVPFFNEKVFTRCDLSPRAYSAVELADMLGRAHVEAVEDPWTAFESLWNQAGPGDLVCVTGSFYLGATIRRRFLEREGRSE